MLGKKIISAIAAVSVSMAVTMVARNCYGSKYVTMVQNGSLETCPNYTVNDLVKDYIGSPTWKHINADDGNDYVNIGGKIKYADKKVRGVVQFLVKGDKFSFYAFEIDGEPQNELVAAALLTSMCEAAKEKDIQSGKAKQDFVGSAQDTAQESAQQSNTDSAKLNSFTDSRDGKTYKTMRIGGQTWMAENLNYAATGSKCYGQGGVVVAYSEESGDLYGETLADRKIQANCAQYGRLYNWETAMKACPAGHHLPSDDEWTTLMYAVGGQSTAGAKLKSTSGWDGGGNVTDEYGFAALPGGGGFSSGTFELSDYYGVDEFNGVGFIGAWWSATENVADNAWSRCLYHDRQDVDKSRDGKTNLYSVRCVAN